jgi:hypothetical protein
MGSGIYRSGGHTGSSAIKSIQRGMVGFAGGTGSQDVTVSEVVVDKCVLVAGHTGVGGASAGIWSSAISWRLVDATTIRFEWLFSNGSAIPGQIPWTLIEFN